MKVYVTRYEHRHGSDTEVYATAEAAEAARQGIAADWWDKEMPNEAKPEDRGELADIYFRRMAERDEFFSIEECEVWGIPVAADSRDDEGRNPITTDSMRTA